MGSDLLSDIRREIEARLAQLRPAVEEYSQLLAAAEAIEDDGVSDAAGAEAIDRNGTSDLAKNGLAQRAAEKGGLANSGSGSAPRGRGHRASVSGGASAEGDRALREAIAAALEHGSHTPAELAVVTGEDTTQINRELRRLEGAGLVAKSEREGKLAWSLVSLATSD